MEAWRPRLILLSAQFEFRTATTLLCAAIVSVRSLIPRFTAAISGGAADRNTCWRNSPFELPQNACIRRARRSPGAVVRRVSQSAGKVTVASPAVRRSRLHFAQSSASRRALSQRKGQAFAAQRVARSAHTSSRKRAPEVATLFRRQYRRGRTGAAFNFCKHLLFNSCKTPRNCFALYGPSVDRQVERVRCCTSKKVRLFPQARPYTSTRPS